MRTNHSLPADERGRETTRRRVLQLLGAGAAASSVAVAGCTTDIDTPTASPTGGEDGADPAAWTESLDADREFWIAMGDVAHRDSFFPSTTIVRQGEEVGVHLRNTGDEPHDFEIPAFDVAAEDVAEGAAVNRTFTADEPGVHPIECELHPQWMWGQLVVLPDGGGFPTSDERTLRMVMGDVAGRDSFVPSTNVVVEGEAVSVKLKNTGDEPHDFEIPAFDIAAEDVAEGAELTRSFTASEPGVHEVECELHPQWMYGQLVVLPADGDFSKVAASDERTLRMVMGDVAGRESFFPSTNVVKKGEEVAVKLKNTGEEVHDMDIEAFDVEVDVEAGDETELSFTADEAGLHRIVCELHPPEMNGQLWVVP
jgi:plastocyanin